MRPFEREPYSYRGDPQVPSFDDRGPIVFMDGECLLCTGAARAIARLDDSGEFRICPVKSSIGSAVLAHYGLDSRDPDSWLYLEDGQAYGSMDAIVRAGNRLGGWGRLVRFFQIFPQPVQDWIYRRIAKNRYALLGRTQMCEVADPALQQRLMK